MSYRHTLANLSETERLHVRRINIDGVDVASCGLRRRKFYALHFIAKQQLDIRAVPCKSSVTNSLFMIFSKEVDSYCYLAVVVASTSTKNLSISFCTTSGWSS